MAIMFLPYYHTTAIANHPTEMALQASAIMQGPLARARRGIWQVCKQARCQHEPLYDRAPARAGRQPSTQQRRSRTAAARAPLPQHVHNTAGVLLQRQCRGRRTINARRAAGPAVPATTAAHRLTSHHYGTRDSPACIGSSSQNVSPDSPAVRRKNRYDEGGLNWAESPERPRNHSSLHGSCLYNIC